MVNIPYELLGSVLCNQQIPQPSKTRNQKKGVEPVFLSV